MGRAIIWRPFAEGMLDRIFFHACIHGSHLGSQPTRMHARWVLKTLEHIKDDQTRRGSKGKSPPIKGREFARHDQKILKKRTKRLLFSTTSHGQLCEIQTTQILYHSAVQRHGGLIGVIAHRRDAHQLSAVNDAFHLGSECVIDNSHV